MRPTSRNIAKASKTISKSSSKSSSTGQTTLMAYFGFCLLLAVYFVASSGSDAGSRKGGDEDDALALLGGGGGSSSNTRPVSGDDYSILDDPFGNTGSQPEIEDTSKLKKRTGNEDDEPEILDPTDASNPKNPKTGSPYTNSQMAKFDTLRAKFPNNSIIPRKKTPEEAAAEKTQRQEMHAMQSSIVTGKSSAEEVNRYYDYKAKPIKDRVELLTYVLEKNRGKLSEQILEQYEKILKMNQNVLEAQEKSRANALTKNSGGSEGGE